MKIFLVCIKGMDTPVKVLGMKYRLSRWSGLTIYNENGRVIFQTPYHLFICIKDMNY